MVCKSTTIVPDERGVVVRTKGKFLRYMRRIPLSGQSLSFLAAVLLIWKGGFYMIANIKRSAARMSKVRVIVTCGILIALGVVLRSAAIPFTATNRLTMTFLAIAAAGYLLGAVPAMLVGLLIDLLGFLVNPMGAYFPGFTLSAMLTGLVYGLCLYRRPLKTIVFWIIGAQLVISFGIHVVLNTVWLQIMYQKAYTILSMDRIIKNAVLFVPQVIITFAATTLLDRLKIGAKL